METYQQIFDGYLVEIRSTIAAANAWWVGLQASEATRLQTDPADVAESLTRRWPFGPASHPFVLGCYRKWSLICQELNDKFEDRDEDDNGDDAAIEADWGTEDRDYDDEDDIASLEAPIEPRDLLINMLPGRADDVAEFIALMVFDPVGMDKDSRWV